MIRVCYVIPSLGIGGSERQLVSLVRGLAPDHDIMIVCTGDEGGLTGEVRRTSAQVHVLHARSGWDFRVRQQLRPLLRAHQPDVLHTFLFGFDLFANQAAHDAGVPVVVSSRRQLATWKKRRHIFIQKRANQYVQCIVANSQAVARFAIEQEKADPNLFRVIPNGIDADGFLSRVDLHMLRQRFRIPFHRRVIGIVANFSPVKDHALFVDTARILLQRRADLHFLTVGSGPLAPKIDRLIHSHGLTECFTRVASVIEIPDLYALMDVSVLCSRVEGFPNAVIESMAAGKPIVAAAVGGVTELVRDRETGRLVSSRRPEDFADAIEWVLDHPDESQHMVLEAGQFVRTELTMDRMVNGYRALYAELLEKRGR